MFIIIHSLSISLEDHIMTVSNYTKACEDRKQGPTKADWFGRVLFLPSKFIAILLDFRLNSTDTAIWMITLSCDWFCFFYDYWVNILSFPSYPLTILHSKSVSDVLPISFDVVTSHAQCFSDYIMFLMLYMWS